MRSDRQEQKKVPDSCYINKMRISRIKNRQKTQKAQKDKKNSYVREKVENTDLYKPILNKMMTTHKQCVKHKFVAPLRFGLSQQKLENCSTAIFRRKSGNLGHNVLY